MDKLLKAALTIALCLCAGFSAASNGAIDTKSRVIAFGDVHGAYTELTGLLRELGVIDEEYNWSGEDTHLLSLGDLVDRGPDSRAVVELMMKLQGQARSAGGSVHQILGNHEVLLLTGDLRYVSAEDFTAFAMDESAAEREKFLAEYRKFKPDQSESAARTAFEQAYPPGFFALRKAYASDGYIGKWLLQQAFTVRVNDRIFMHGGISAAIAENDIEDINSLMKKDLLAFISHAEVLRAAGVFPYHVSYDDSLDFLNARASEFLAENPGEKAEWFPSVVGLFELQNSFALGTEGVVWYRGSAVCHPLSESFNVERFLKRNNARQLVIGHQASRGVAISRMDGLVLRLDTGMLTSVYDGLAAALVIDGDKSHIHYLGNRQEQPRQFKWTLRDRNDLGGDEATEAFLADATALDPSGDASSNLLGLVSGDKQSKALRFDVDDAPGLNTLEKYSSRRHDKAQRHVYNTAAYKLDRLIDLYLVPVSMTRNVEGEPETLSAWPPGVKSESQRIASGEYFSSYCSQQDQYRLRDVFDILIGNNERGPDNILWSDRTQMLRLVDHTAAFNSSKKPPKIYRKTEPQISDLLAEKLESLTSEELSSALDPYLHPQQIEAVLARRDYLLKSADRTSP